MGQTTAIEWTDHTFNPWWGCVKVSEACRHCYAETWAKRYGTGWGPTARRRFFGEKHWNQPRHWNARAKREGIRRRVFCASMADVFEILPDDHPDKGRQANERWRLLDLIEETPALDWLLLTKRPENVVGLLDRWSNGYPPNVWVGTTVEDQQQADRRIPHLLKVPARVRFLSCEPLLGPVNLDQWLKWPHCTCDGEFSPCPTCDDLGPRPDLEDSLHWVIVGGESGHGARPMHPDWARSLRDQCQAAGVAYHFKQWGSLVPAGHHPAGMTAAEYNATVLDGQAFYHVGKKAAGRLLDGRTWDEFPEVA